MSQITSQGESITILVALFFTKISAFPLAASRHRGPSAVFNPSVSPYHHLKEDTWHLLGKSQLLPSGHCLKPRPPPNKGSLDSPGFVTRPMKSSFFARLTCLILYHKLNMVVNDLSVSSRKIPDGHSLEGGGVLLLRCLIK
jgi:hypothetical protein